ncbi:MAG: (d)CMP kinase [Aquificaceae bacterium]
MKIAIDGPSGSGKSTVAKRISQLLSIPYLDTGSVYRAFAYVAKVKNIDTSKVCDVLKLFENNIEVKLYLSRMEIFYMERKLERELKDEEIGRGASLIASVPEFRERMVEFFRKLVGDGQVVAEGRDVGTHIFPDAPIKLFITASLEERAKRRHKELLSMGENVSYETVFRALEERDKRDVERPVYPFKPATDAILIDTTDMSVDRVVEMALSMIKKIYTFNR